MTRNRAKKNRILIVLLLISLVLSGCGAKNAAVGYEENKVAGDAENITAGDAESITAGDTENKIAFGEYEVALTMEGGTGKASMESPCLVEVTEEGNFANLKWSSKNYDYMIVDGEKYLNLTPGEKSTFRIPIKVFDEPIEMIADTTAMSTPHEITYQVTIHSPKKEGSEKNTATENADNGKDTNRAGKENFAGVAKRDVNISKELVFDHSGENEYAMGYAIDEYEGGYALLTTASDGRYLLIDEGKPVPSDIASDIVVLQAPIDGIYVASTSAMDMFAACGGLSNVRFSSISEDSWSITKIRQAMQNGEIEYAGKYSAPDYERLLAGECRLAIENTMIYHSPQVKEQLIRSNIPVLMDYSNYEETPLGRCEWIKLFGRLLGKEEEAEKAFLEQKNLYETAILEAKSMSDKPKVVYFYINSSGQPVVRSSTDYMAAMIADAGGKYAFSELTAEGSMSTIVMTMEDFFAMGSDADVMIYNSTIVGEVQSRKDLLGKSALLSDFAAFQKGNIYCTESNVYQASMEMGDVVKEIGMILLECGEDGEVSEELKFFHKVQE